MGTVTKKYELSKIEGNSWYDSMFKVLLPVENNEVIWYRSYLRNAFAYKKGINLKGRYITVYLRVGNYLGMETEEAHVISAYDYKNKIKFDVYFKLSPTDARQVNIRLVYSSELKTTEFNYNWFASWWSCYQQGVFKFTVDTAELLANGTYYRYKAYEDNITYFSFESSDTDPISFDRVESIIAIGTDAVQLNKKKSEYGRFSMFNVEVDETPVFNVIMNKYFGYSLLLDNVTNTPLITFNTKINVKNSLPVTELNRFNI